MPPDRLTQPLALVLPLRLCWARELLMINTSSGSLTLQSYGEQNVPRQMLPCLTRSSFGETSQLEEQEGCMGLWVLRTSGHLPCSRGDAGVRGAEADWSRPLFTPAKARMAVAAHTDLESV